MRTLQKPEATASSAGSPGNPSIIFETLNRYQHSMALKGALELDLFTHIAAGASTAGDIALRCDASERGVRILCDFLTVIGFLKKTDDAYFLTPDSAVFLDRNSPAYFGTVANFIAHADMLDRFRDVAALVRRGSPAACHSFLKPENERWVAFAPAYPPLSDEPFSAAPRRYTRSIRRAAGRDASLRSRRRGR